MLAGINRGILRENMKIPIKPMSVNAAWRSSKRYKTKEYIQYIKGVNAFLKPLEVPDGELELHLQIGVSNKGFDLDNSIKPFVDILQKKYDFNDNRIHSISAHKRIVPKGQEYISFDLFECFKTPSWKKDNFDEHF